jgi:hypothetical protein
MPAAQRQGPPKDNSTGERKTALRRTVLRDLRAAGLTPVVMETHCGYGHLYRACYRDIPSGVAFDKNLAKASFSARERPTWAVYGGECVAAIQAGAGAHLCVNLLDLDPYGEPWPVLDAFFTSDRPRAQRLYVVVNDGLRQMLQRGGAWRVASLVPLIPKYGNRGLYDRYLDAAQDLMRQTAAQAGYRLRRWAGYYTGHSNQMSHYYAVLERPA